MSSQEEFFTIEGIAINYGKWSRPSENDHSILARSKCFRMYGSTQMRFAHDPAKLVAWSRDGSLELWHDQRAVYFSASLPWNRFNSGLRRGVLENTFRECSVLFPAGRSSIVYDDDGSEEVLAADLPELSICENGRMPGTACWIADEEMDQLPAPVRTARILWNASVMLRNAPSVAPPTPPQARLNASVRGRSADMSAVYAQIDRILAESRPTGWMVGSSKEPVR